ncbi:hypothetical protein SAMN04488564_12425 [Lentzea waywayandensis]|uniref:Uncharacterized protein n=1 Tax=Lentzea waywayandensis TaxID=84724 RepID=A0A1I6FJ27_9PSEU|nr:hypothetical protein [Lentzea waywayandensis]SFR29932.1 hypothetical protein SAMN04488564_12425 [Lentzea waywayandensis]
MAVPDPRSVEDALLLEVHRELVRQHDDERAEEIVDLLASVVAGEELIAAVERRDSEAMAFHAGLVLRSLQTGPAGYPSVVNFF